MLTIPYDTSFRFRRNQDVKKIGLVGGTGYTGVELLRMLQDHPEVEILTLTSRSEAGKSVTSLYPWLTGYGAELVFAEPSSNALANCDLVFFATPNKIAMEEAIPFLSAGFRSSIWPPTFGSRIPMYGLRPMVAGMQRRLGMRAQSMAYQSYTGTPYVVPSWSAIQAVTQLQQPCRLRPY